MSLPMAPPRPRSLHPWQSGLLAATSLVAVLLSAGGPRGATASGRCRGQLSVNTASKSYVTGDGVRVSGDKLTLKHNSGVSVTSGCVDEWDPHGFQQFHLLGQTLSYTVDLSRVGCACNVALYLIQAPALDLGGNPTKGTCSYSPYYCDANKVCGQWCPELDIMEANSHTFAATPHTCDASPNPKFNNCDRGGRGRNTKDMPQSFGPGPGFTIDTTQPFIVKTSFHGHNSSSPGGSAAFIGMSTALQQGAKIVMLENQAGPEYLAAMAKSMDGGMSVRITYWGKKSATMDWLDGPVCGPQSCQGSNAGDAIISDIWISPIGAPPPPPPTSSTPRPTPAPTEPPLPVAPPPVVPVAPPSPSPSEGPGVAKGPPVQHIIFGSALLLVGCVCLCAAASAHLRRARAEEVVGSCANGLAEAGCRDCAAEAFQECQEAVNHASESEMASSKVLRALQEHCWEVLLAAMEFGATLAHHLRTACGSLASIVSELSQQTASNRAAFRKACERASGEQAARGQGRDYEVLQESLEVGDVVSVLTSFDAPGRFIGTAHIVAGTKGVVEQIEIDMRGGSAVVRFDGHKGSFRLSAELLLNLQANIEEVQSRRKRDGLTVVAVLSVTALVVLTALIWWLSGAAAGAVSSPAPHIPVGGCCTWQDHTQCGVTTDFCKHPQACEQSCLGKWIMPR